MISCTSGYNPEHTCCHPEPVEGRPVKHYDLKQKKVRSSIQKRLQSALRQAQDDNLGDAG